VSELWNIETESTLYLIRLTRQKKKKKASESKGGGRLGERTSNSAAFYGGRGPTKVEALTTSADP